MLRNLINAKHTTEIYKVTAESNRGSVVVKNLVTKSADKASGVGTEVYLLDYDFQPTGVWSDSEISDYTKEADTINAGSLAILIKSVAGEQWATDQIDTTGLVVGDYLIAGTGATAGKFIKATTGKVSVFRYTGTYDDAGHVLQAFDVVETKTV